jgi:purine-binding chemotaxis protein CheW
MHNEAEAIDFEEDVEHQEAGEAEVHHYLSFLLSDETYGVDIVRIKEILEFPSITKVPMVPDYISGVINLRGNVVPVINLARRFDKPAKEITKRSCILIIEIKQDDIPLDIGVRVEAVNEVLTIAETELEPAPAFGVRIKSEYIRHMGRIGKEFVVLLDVDKVLNINELSMFEIQETQNEPTIGDDGNSNLDAQSV